MKVLILVLLTIFFVSCGPKKLAVNNADTLITHQITKRLPLYSAQKDELSKDVDKFLINTKPTAQEIVPIIDRLDLSDEKKLESQYNILEGHYKKIAQDFSAIMSKYMSQLDPKQQKDFFATLEEENQKISRKLKSNQMNEIHNRFKMFFGSINGEQKRIFSEYKDYFKGRAKTRLDRRIKLHEQFKTAFQDDLSTTSREKMFQDAFAVYQNEALQENKNLEILKKIAPTLSADQKKYFKKEAEEIKDTLKYFLTVDY